MIELLLICFYFMMPAYFANMAPVLVKRVNIFAFPIDFNKRINKKPILGTHKTFRGLIFGILFAIIVAYLQFLLYNQGFFENISLINYQNWLLFGFLMGLGALTGDMAKSFLKRRLGINPGNRFIPFDQIDYTIGAFVFIMPIFDWSIKLFIVALSLNFVLHIITNHIAFYLKMRDSKW